MNDILFKPISFSLRIKIFVCLGAGELEKSSDTMEYGTDVVDVNNVSKGHRRHCAKE